MRIEDETGLESSDNVKPFTGKFKKSAPPERVLVHPWEVPKGDPCGHLMATYIVNEKEASVECGRCGEKLNPMWVLHQLATKDRRMAETYENTKRLNELRQERSRCKCQHCGKMTRIRGL